MNLGSAVLDRLIGNRAQGNAPNNGDTDNSQGEAHKLLPSVVCFVALVHRLDWLDRLSCLTASVWRLFAVRWQPESVESRPGRLLLGRFWCQLLIGGMQAT